MLVQLCITVRFLQPYYHGRGEGGTPEWPPSPMRLFQALVAAAAARWNQRERLVYAVPALEALASQPPPLIIAPKVRVARTGYRTYVPDNAGDEIAKAWSRGNLSANVTELLVEKDVRPMYLSVQEDTVHYVYPIKEQSSLAEHIQTVIAASRNITHLGWGVDMVSGEARTIATDELLKLQGERWQPDDEQGSKAFRIPNAATLRTLIQNFTLSLDRTTDQARPVPPLTEFDVVNYRREDDVPGRPWVAFNILKPDMSGNLAFNTPRRCRDVAAWTRNATGNACEHWPWGDVASFVHGHNPANTETQLKGENADNRFQFLPLPTVNFALNRIETIRRVLIAAPVGAQDRIDWIRRRLPGQELVWNDGVVGVLNLLPTSDWVLQQYIGTSDVWSTVTPVIWPGHDDRNPAKAERLLRKAFVDAGLPQSVVDSIVQLEWRGVGFRAGLDLARNYVTPEQLHGSRYHVRVRFANAVTGPLAVGAGRYRGFGLFAAES